jgi:hypothetical protein
MTTYTPQTPWPRVVLGTLLLGILGGARARGQGQPNLDETLWREPVLGRTFSPDLLGDRPGESPAGRVPRARLFRMPAGLLYEQLGLDSGDDPTLPDANGPPGPGDNGPIQVAMGLDNPFFDYRLRSDPGGVGYYKVNSQLQLLDEGKTCLSLGFQAVTPAGLENGGLADGPTVFCPAIAWFQELGEGTALQGFVCKNIRANSRWSDELENNIEYGMGVQCAIPGLSTDPNRGVHFFVEAVGRYRVDGETLPGRPMTWEFIPGIHWRLGDKWWLSVGAARTNVITCSWQF